MVQGAVAWSFVFFTHMAAATKNSLGSRDVEFRCMPSGPRQREMPRAPVCKIGGLAWRLRFGECASWNRCEERYRECSAGSLRGQKHGFRLRVGIRSEACSLGVQRARVTFEPTNPKRMKSSEHVGGFLFVEGSAGCNGGLSR